jgi:hypothetical protein
VTLSLRDGAPGKSITGMAIGAAGEFELRGVPPGQYTAIAQLRGPGGAESLRCSR